MGWVRDIFSICHGLSGKSLPTPPSVRSGLYAPDTDFASVCLQLGDSFTKIVTLLFFQDPDGWIRWGGIEHNFSSELRRNEFLFKERIAHGKRRSPLAVAAGRPGPDSYETNKV